MWDFIATMGDLGRELWGAVPVTREFWSGVIGTVVGGGITFLAQSRGFREQRKQRAEDRLRGQLGLAYSMFFKMMRIHSDFYGVHRHIEDCFEKAARENSKATRGSSLFLSETSPTPFSFLPMK